jgi:hypothetical protein
MARSTCLIGLSRPVIEGYIAEGRESGPRPARPAFAAEAPAGGAPPQEASLAAFLAEAGWEPSVAVVVLPTEEATFRRLKFPFREPRRIRQVIRFELEAELLDDIAQFTIEQEIAPAGEAAAEVQAYLVKTERVQAAVETCRAAGLSPYRITLSVHALLAARPPQAPLTFQVYAGAEESFTVLVRQGRIEAVRAIGTGLSALVLDLHRQGIATAQEIHRVLAGDVEPDKVNRALVRSRMMHELTGLATEVNLFLRAHDQGQPFAVECHGLFGGYLRRSDGGRIEAVADAPRAGDVPERRYLGILEELQAAPLALRTRQGINFYTAGAGLLGQLTELRRPLIAAAVVSMLVLGLTGTRYILRTVELWRDRSAIEAQIQTVLRKNIASNPSVGMGLPILRERVQKAREEAKGTARFASYRYDTLALLSDLSGSIGKSSGITVESLTLGKDRVSLVGTTPSFQASEGLKNQLATLAAFKGKEPKLTHQRAGQTITFRLTID